jgi:hypothetical protein
VFEFWKKVGKQKEMTHFHHHHHHHLVVNQMLNLWDRIELDVGILEQKCTFIIIIIIIIILWSI